MTCNDKCIHYSVCEQKKYDFANIDECMYYATKFETMLEKEENEDKQCRCCGITYPNEHLEKITLGKHYLKLCPNCYSEFSKIFYPTIDSVKDECNEWTSVCTGTCYGRDTFSAEDVRGEKE